MPPLLTRGHKCSSTKHARAHAHAHAQTTHSLCPLLLPNPPKKNQKNGRGFEGTEYTVTHAQDPVLQVIRKQYRRPGKKPVAQAYYYIARGNAFQAPDLSSVVSSRLVCVCVLVWVWEEVLDAV